MANVKVKTVIAAVASATAIITTTTSAEIPTPGLPLWRSSCSKQILHLADQWRRPQAIHLPTPTPQTLPVKILPDPSVATETTATTATTAVTLQNATIAVPSWFKELY